MSYTALYRKFRPQTFDEVRGQDHIVAALKNQINTGRIGHAYLFTGTRGTGKTSVAKIFAKAVNCENPKDGSPCGGCETCRAIAAGASMNVIEIDAASNNGVDSIREIVDEVSYSPASGKYKVYIIDEVHMLSTGAFNALLKTLEEPPSYVIFILATTEVQKIPVTILSRCQRYDFRRISVGTISSQLSDLTEREDINAEPRALDFIARTADGSMRDALSLLDQCAAFYYGRELTYDNVLKVLGAVDTSVFSDFLRAVVTDDVAACIKRLDTVVAQGRELTQFITDFTWYLRNLMILEASDQSGEEVENILNLSSDNMKLLREEAKAVPLPMVMRYIRIFADLSNQIKYATQKRVLVEVAIIRMCRPQMETDHGSELERIRKLENEIEELKENGVAMPQSGSRDNDSDDVAAAAARVIDPATVSSDINIVASQWNDFVQRADGYIRLWLKQCTFSVDENKKAYLVTPSQNTYAFWTYKADPAGGMINLQYLTDEIERVCHQRITLNVKLAENRAAMKREDPDYAKQMINAHIEIADDNEEAAIVDRARRERVAADNEPQSDNEPQADDAGSDTALQPDDTGTEPEEIIQETRDTAEPAGDDEDSDIPDTDEDEDDEFDEEERAEEEHEENEDD